MRFFFLLLLATFLFTSCRESGKKYDKSIKDWPEPKLLQGDQILENEYSHLYTELVDSLLIAVTNRDTLFHFYNKKRDHIVSVGKKGRGPAEFPMPPILEDFYKQGDTTKAIVYNQFRRKLTVINISASIEKAELVIESNKDLPEKMWGLRRIKYLGPENGYIGIYEDRGPKRIDGKSGGFYASKGLEKIDFFPLTNLRVEPFERTPAIKANGRTPGISPKGDKLATVLAYYPLAEVVDIPTNNTRQYLLEPNPPDSVFSLEEFKNQEIDRYSRDMYVTEDNIYILTTNEITTSGDQKIRVIDWKGNVENEFQIPSKYELSSIVIEEEERKIYGTSYTNDAAYIFEY